MHCDRCASLSLSLFLLDFLLFTLFLIPSQFVCCCVLCLVLYRPLSLIVQHHWTGPIDSLIVFASDFFAVFCVCVSASGWETIRWKTQVIDDGKNILHVLAWIMICILSPGTCLLYAWHSGVTTLTCFLTSCFHAMPLFFLMALRFCRWFFKCVCLKYSYDVPCEFI